MGYKLKSKKSASKRFSFTANGKIKRKKAFLRHMLRKRTTSVKRKLRATGLIAAVDAPSIKRMLPYC